MVIIVPGTKDVQWEPGRDTALEMDVIELKSGIGHAT